MPETHYNAARKKACALCAEDIPIDIQRKRRNEDGMEEKTRTYPKGGVASEPLQHILGYADYSTFNVPNKWGPCTAPSLPEFAEQMAAENAELLRERDRAIKLERRLAKYEPLP